MCWIAVVVGAGVFASAEDGLREWRYAVGPAATGVALSSCAAGMTARLLAPCLQTGVLADMLEGREPRELIHEYYRLRRRARDLTGSADAGAGSSPFDAGVDGVVHRAKRTRRRQRRPVPQSGPLRGFSAR